MCGAQVEVGALACRSCGADETSGWSDASLYDDLDLPEPAGGEPVEVPDTFEEFERLARRPRELSPRAILVIGAVLVVAIALASVRPF